MQQSAVGHNNPPCLEMTFNRAATNSGHYQRRAKSLVPFFTVNVYLFDYSISLKV